MPLQMMKLVQKRVQDPPNEMLVTLAKVEDEAEVVKKARSDDIDAKRKEVRPPPWAGPRPQTHTLMS